MFRRNKNKGGSASDMVALTGPDVLSSSSGADSSSSMTRKKGSSGGRFAVMSRRKSKKKNDTTITSSSTNRVKKSSGSSTNIMTAAMTTGSNIKMSLLSPESARGGPPPLLKDISINDGVIAGGNNNNNIGNNANVRKSSQQQQRQQQSRNNNATNNPPPLMSLDNKSRGRSNTSSAILSATTSKNNAAPQSKKSPSRTTSQQQQQSSSSASSKQQQHNNNNNGNIVINEAKPLYLARSGWSMTLNDASSAMNSEHYIQSLNNLPNNTTTSMNVGSAANANGASSGNKAYPMLNTTTTTNESDNYRIRTALSDERIRSALSRQFGRWNYPPIITNNNTTTAQQQQQHYQKWFVKVGQCKWDKHDGRYKYKVSITKNPTHDNISEEEGSDSMMEGGGGMTANLYDGDNDSYSQQLSFTSTSTSRSLQDFVWLEQALRAEYHGALLVPMLSLALFLGELSEKAASTTTGNTAGGDDNEDQSLSMASHSYTTDATSKNTTNNNHNQNDQIQVLLSSVTNGQSESIVPSSFRYLDIKMERNQSVNETLLSHWLSDILNGIRGNGEVLLNNNTLGSIMESEAMETFLYRHSDTTFNANNSNAKKNESHLGSLPFGNFFSIAENKCQTPIVASHGKSLFESFMENPFECFGMETVCGNNGKKKGGGSAQQQSKRQALGNMMCSSGATGVPGIGHCNSYLSQTEVGEQGVDMSTWLLQSSSAPNNIATHSELLEAEKDLIASYLKTSSLAITKVMSLSKDESHVGQCWKRFAVSLSDLFSVEKDLEQAHIGDSIKSNKKKQLFRKLRKSVVDDALRTLARGKMERSHPSLVLLGSMMNAYYADLNSIVPAFREYSEAIHHLHQLDDATHSVKSSNNNNLNQRKNNANHQQRTRGDHTNDEWNSSLEYLKSLTWGATQHLTGGGTVVTHGSDPIMDDETSIGSLSTAQTKVLQRRVLSNEKLLKYSITQLCKSSPLRNARMAWWYLKTEAKQALNVHTAATTLRQKLSIDPDVASAMKERKYEEDEKKDNEAELELVKRILNLGSASSSSSVSVSDDDDGSNSCMFQRDENRQDAIRIATEQVGRWNAKTALALMAAAGVDDAEVKIDETSRELRHVRKYAISLRENVARCLEAAEALAASFILNSEGATVQISRSRREFWAAISAVFSGKIISDESTNGPNNGSIGTLSMRVLSSVGIDTTDRGGWLGHNSTNNQTNPQRRNCGEAARQYLKKRDNQASILLSRIVKLLKDYERRLEGIESFVYMHCVGIQLEKHCSKARTKALSAWEKRTDISTAINVATKKKIPKLVQELKVKLDALPQVSHTTVLKKKEEHLASKTLKSDLHKLANRRFGRAQEVSTERVIAVMSLWAKHEESVAIEEVKALGEAVQEVELSIQGSDVDAALNCGSVALYGARDSPAQNRSLLM